MSDKNEGDDDPGFLEDTVEESSDQSHDDSAPSFNPFTDVGKVDTGMAAVGSGPATNPAAGGEVHDGVGPASSLQPHVQDEEDVVPGSGQDLWKCPHCNAGNKPGRDTCRSCGKHPEDRVASTLAKQVVIAGGALILFVVVALVVVMSGVDTSYRPPAASNVDEDVRLDGHAFAATGRVLTVQPSEHGATAVLIVFDPVATDDAVFDELRAEFGSQILVKRGNDLVKENEYALVHLVTEEPVPALERGAWISIAGDELERPALRRFEYVVGLREIGTK